MAKLFGFVQFWNIQPEKVGFCGGTALTVGEGLGISLLLGSFPLEGMLQTWTPYARRL